MPHSLPTRHAMRARKRKKSILTSWWFWVIATVVLVAVAAVAWIGVRGLQAKTELEAAQGKIGELKSQALSLDIAGATKTLDAIKDHTKNAISLTDDPVWRAGELIPWLGGNLTAVRELAVVTDEILVDVATPLIGVAGNVDPASFAPKDGAINLQPIIDAIPALHEANAGLKRAIATVDGINTDGTISQVVSAQEKVSGMLAELAPTLDTLESVVPLLPPAMGSEGPRTYVIMFQNPAEARALGGTALSFAVIKVDQGRIELSETIPAGFSNFAHYGTSVIPIPDGAEAVYPEVAFGTFIANATVRPSFTTAAEITQETWRQQFGYTVDGILSIDPVALDYILRSTDPITLSSGDVLTSTPLVPFLLNTVWVWHSDSTRGRRAGRCWRTLALDRGPVGAGGSPCRRATNDRDALRTTGLPDRRGFAERATGGA